MEGERIFSSLPFWSSLDGGSFDENEARGENVIESARRRDPGYCKPKKTPMNQAKTDPL